MTRHARALKAPGGPMVVIDRPLLARAVDYARESPRRRVIQPFHERADDPLHRMLNAMQPDSYVRPHRHLQPPKSEAWVMLQGSVAFFTFDDAGGITACQTLSANSDAIGVDLAPGIYHTLLALEPDSVLFEAKNGPYSEHDDKSFAPWAPAEGEDAARDYLQALREHALERSG